MNIPAIIAIFILIMAIIFWCQEERYDMVAIHIIGSVFLLIGFWIIP